MILPLMVETNTFGNRASGQRGKKRGTFSELLGEMQYS
jgi:hypothetical protein